METARRLIRWTDKLVDLCLWVLLAALLLYGGFALWDTYRVYDSAGVDNTIMFFKPGGDDITNPSFKELEAINPNVCAWVTLDNTRVDYPVLIGPDNAKYLNSDIYGNYSLSGSIFLDYRLKRDFSDYYLLLYGHHMDGGAMFGDIKKFEETEFFENNTSGWLFLPGMTYTLEIYAYLHEDAYTSPMFDVELDETGFEARLDYIAGSAVHYRDIGVSADDRIIALSTCSSASTNGRSIVVARMTEHIAEEGQAEK